VERQAHSSQDGWWRRWNLALFILWIEVLLVAFCTIFAFVAFNVLLFEVVSTVRFQRNPDSIVGFNGTLRLREQETWKNWLWFVFSAFAVGAATLAFISAGTQMWPIRHIQVDTEGDRGFLLMGLAWMAMGTVAILMRRAIVEGNRGYREFTRRIGLPYQTDRQTETGVIIIGTVGIVAGLCVLLSLLVMRSIGLDH
jgi:hypothetical protein